MSASPFPASPGSVVMYSTSWCGYCRRLTTQLNSANIPYTEINIEETPGTADYVESVNGGNQTVPTLVFADGTAMTNPSLAQVKDKLEQLSS
ncbi:mycoredoxin [Jonesia denitrificans]|uniref:Glutaredoxin-like protein n=1 Tax=Jonesia denitrificans (strain ATCC 14870 / DSM 20603 / BCRC 15368 / CIP 55.134 / JCM 11481 / NBRC 15587 / NCTC 10816 / Prevot 55134) TaxID=471856 RepID=C7R1R0_JONDD|nr:mycoredoxin [Jonesia denitrificans]ACV08378.1 glutaredoxin-like protein [Jonesia denitrificans DSM 20603]ASE07968.1 glutaredoxin-like protein [Jonesia denitrificans]QXB42574.1 mycoredoxin [Jonesia denitrificans]SQH20358.1 glutaredoxin-like protein [Jonesia denitrificans]